MKTFVILKSVTKEIWGICELSRYIQMLLYVGGFSELICFLEIND